MSDLTAEKYLSNIGFDDSHLPEMFNDDDKSYYKVTELMESYFEARSQANGDNTGDSGLYLQRVSVSSLYKNLMSNQRELINSPLRANVVSVEAIKEEFKKIGFIEDSKF